jgi:methylase of polypeptide subunit release factors
LGTLVKLFALCERLPSAAVRQALDPIGLEDVSQTGLLTVDGDCAIPNYRLLPHGQLLVGGDGRGPSSPNVVSAFTGPSLDLARLTPRMPVGSMLDVGAGSGIQALLGAHHCERVTATDVNPRALMFVRFNARLNATANIDALEGSWFEPVGERQFELIVCNPPYVVSPDHDLAYRDSGLRGTDLLERLTREAAEHLAPGGLAVALCSWPHASQEDWAAAPASAAAGTGCDALIICHSTVDPLDYATNWNTPPVAFHPPAQLRQTVARWLEHYRSIGAGALSYGAVILRRRRSGSPWVSALKAAAPPGELAAEHLLRLLAGRDLLEALDDRGLLAARFTLPDGVSVSQRFQRREARFVARPAMIRFEDGLGVSAAVAPDALDVLFACDGCRTLSAAVEAVALRRRAGVETITRSALAAARELLAHGLLAH